MTQLGAGANEIVFPPSTDSDPYPDKPVEVDDAYIYVDRIMPQPPGTLSLMTGFNKGIDIYMTMNPLAGVELSYGITQLPWSNQKNMLNECVQAAKQVTERLPAELSIDLAAQGPDVGSEAGTAAQPIQLPPTEYFDALPGFQYYPPSESMESNDLRRVLGTQPGRRRGAGRRAGPRRGGGPGGGARGGGGRRGAAARRGGAPERGGPGARGA